MESLKPLTSGFRADTLARSWVGIAALVLKCLTRKSPMRLIVMGAFLILAISAAIVAQFPMEQPVALHQNHPNPLCLQVDTATCILFKMSRAPYLTLEVWTLGTTALLRNLIKEHPAAGLHMVCCDGRDDSGQFVADEIYPYATTVADSFGRAVVLADILVARVGCGGACEGNTWRRLKAFYGR